MKRVKLFNDYLSMNSQMLGLSRQEYTSRFLSEKFDGIGDLVKSLHFEINPKTAEEKKIELGKRQGEVSKRKQKESGEYSLRLFRKKIKYGNCKDVGVFLPGSYDASVSTLGDGPHKKAVKKVTTKTKKVAKAKAKPVQIVPKVQITTESSDVDKRLTFIEGEISRQSEDILTIKSGLESILQVMKG